VLAWPKGCEKLLTMKRITHIQEKSEIEKDDTLEGGFPYFITPNEIVDIEGAFTVYEKMTYFILCRYGNNGKVAFPSYNTIGRKGGFSKDTAIKAVRGLLKKGLISKETKRDKKGNYLSNNYKVIYTLPGGVVAVSDKGGSCERQGVVAVSDNINNKVINKKERGDTLNSLNKKEQDNPVVKWKELYEKHYNFVPKVTGREGKVLKDTVKQYGYDCTIKLLELYLKHPTANEKENGNPLPWLPGAINRLLLKIKEAEEYAKRLARSDEEARQMNERMRQHEEEQRKEEARRAAMSEEARQLDDLYSERIRLISRIDIRLLTNRDYSELESRLRELDRQEIELTRQPIAASC
jgi:hypothetical protein